MKEVNLCILGVKPSNRYPLKVRVINSCGRVIYCNNCSRTRINLCLKRNSIYCITVSFCGYTVRKTINMCNQNNIIIPFNRCRLMNQGRIVTFSLADYNYNNLPIEKGDLVFD